MVHDIFLSYSKQDKTVADALCAGVEAHKIRCWVAPRDVKPGQEWAEAIVDAIESCKVFVIILSSGSNESPQVLREVERAVNQGKIIIPFRIDECTPSKSLGYFLSVPHWLDAMNKPLEKHIDELVTVLQGLIAGTTESSKPPEYLHPPPPPPRYWRWLILSGVLLILTVGIIVISGSPSEPDHGGQGRDAPIVHSPSDGKVVYE